MDIRRVMIGAALLLGVAAAAEAREPAFEFGLGYSRLSIQGDDLLDSNGAAGVRFGLALVPVRHKPAVTIGFHFTASHYRRTRRFDLPPDPELFMVSGQFADLDLYLPEFRLGYRQPLGEGFFVEPSAGVGLLIGTHTTGITRLGVVGHFTDQRTRQTRVGFGVRPGVRAGYNFNGWEAGADVNYLIGRLRLRDAGPRVNELYIGGFVRWMF